MASRFWVGGTGTWDAVTTTNWAATSGGAGGQSVPGSADVVTFDGSSGGGVVTVNTTINVVSITNGAHTGTLDFSANNNNVTLQTFNGAGSGTRTFNMGNGIWTLTGTGTVWTMQITTGLTFNANLSTLVFSVVSSTQRSFITGGLIYNIVTLGANASGGPFAVSNSNTTFGTFNIFPPNYVTWAANTTWTFTTINWIGSSGSEILIKTATDNSIHPTISVASGSPSMTWCGFREMTFSGGATFVASNSFDFGANSGITINPPSGGGSGGGGSGAAIRGSFISPIFAG